MVIFDNCYTVIIFERMNLKTTLVYMALAAVTGMLGIQAQTVQGHTHSGHPTGQPPFPLTSYVELANPQAVDADSWKGVTKPSCAWGSVYERYRKESHPKLHKKKPSPERVERRTGIRPAGYHVARTAGQRAGGNVCPAEPTARLAR